FVDLHQLLRQFIADAGLNQDVLLARPHQQGIQSRLNPVLLVRQQLLRPHRLRNYAKESSAIKKVSSVGNDGEFKIAESCSMHKATFSHQPSGRPPSATAQN